MLKTFGEFHVYSEPKSVADVREWLAEIEKYQLPDTTPLMDGMLSLYVTLPVEPTLCGEHTVDDEKYDIVMITHNHIEEVYEEYSAAEK